MQDELLDMVYPSKYEPFDSNSKVSGKVILLMHDRLFRKGKKINDSIDINDKTELNKLKDVIKYFQKLNSKFKGLDEY